MTALRTEFVRSYDIRVHRAGEQIRTFQSRPQTVHWGNSPSRRIERFNHLAQFLFSRGACPTSTHVQIETCLANVPDRI